MKSTLLVLIALCTTLYCQAQNFEEGNVFKKHIYFNLNLKDHDSLQLVHAEFATDIPYMIRTKITGHNFLGLGRYTIENMSFEIEEIVIEKEEREEFELYIEDVRFKCFVEKFEDECERKSRASIVFRENQKRENEKSKNIAKFDIQLTTTKPSAKDANQMKTKLSVFKNAIFDFKIIPPKEESRNKKREGKTNFGGHICKTAINY